MIQGVEGRFLTTHPLAPFCVSVFLAKLEFGGVPKETKFAANCKLGNKMIKLALLAVLC